MSTTASAACTTAFRQSIHDPDKGDENDENDNDDGTDEADHGSSATGASSASTVPKKRCRARKQAMVEQQTGLRVVGVHCR